MNTNEKIQLGRAIVEMNASLIAVDMYMIKRDFAKAREAMRSHDKAALSINNILGGAYVTLYGWAKNDRRS